MAKEANITEIVQTLQEAQQNKELLSTLTTSLDRYVASQKKGLEELESLISYEWLMMPLLQKYALKKGMRVTAAF